MRVALIIERFEPGAGGLEDAAWRTACALRDAGDAVTVVARRARACDGITSVLLPVAGAGWQPTRVLGFARAAGHWLARARGDGRIDLAHAWSRTPGADLFHGGEGSHLHYMRRTYGPSGAFARRVSPRHAALLALEQRIFSAPTLAFQSVSALVERELTERFPLAPERIHRVAYGVDLTRFTPRAARGRTALRAELDPHAGDAPCFLLAGTGARRKGLDTALAALAAADRSDARLWVAGGDAPGPWRRHADRLGIAERVRFLGRRGDLEHVLAAADALLLPTRYDAFGLVALEAAACARPVVLSATAGSAELVGEAGIVVDDPEDVARFARAIDTLGDTALRTTLGERGLRIACDHGWDAQTARLRDVYRRVAGAGA